MASEPPAPMSGALLRGAMTGLLLAVALHLGYVLLGPNFHTVIKSTVKPHSTL